MPLSCSFRPVCQKQKFTIPLSERVKDSTSLLELFLFISVGSFFIPVQNRILNLARIGRRAEELSASTEGQSDISVCSVSFP